MALPDDETVSGGGTVTLDGSGSGGAWGTNVSYSWALTDPASGVTVSFDDNTSLTPQVTIPTLAADTELTFTLTVTGRGNGSGIAPGTGTATVTVNVICGRTPAVRDAILGRIPGVSNCADVTGTHLAAITGTLDLVSEEITALKSRDFVGLNSLEILQLGDNMLSELPDGVFDELTALKSLLLHENRLSELPDGVFDELTALESLLLHDNRLSELPAGVFAELTALETLLLGRNRRVPFAPTAVALPGDGTVPVAGGMVMLDGSDSDGGPWGTNVTYGWALTTPASGVPVTIDDDTSVTPQVTIPALAADTELTFTLTVTGRGNGSGIASATDTATVATEAPRPATPSLTAELTSDVREHDGRETFRVDLQFSEEVELERDDVRSGRILRITNGHVVEAVTLDGGTTAGWQISVSPGASPAATLPSWAPIEIGLAAPPDTCSAPQAVCTADGRTFEAPGPTLLIEGPATLAVADATVYEAPGAVLEFEVTLSRTASVPVSVRYATKDRTAIAAEDYTRTRGTLEFAPGTTRQVVSVPVLDDALDEGEEDMRLKLSKPGGARLGDGTAIGTIVNNDAMPKAWIARFGRTVADQISDAARERMRAGPVPGATLSLGGRSLLGAPRKYDDGEIEPMAEPRFEERTDLSDRALLTGSSFSVATASGEDAVAAVWAKGAVSRFSGETAEYALDGDVSSVMLGADWRREDWASGVMLAHTRGSGGYEPRSGVQEDEQGTYAGAVESTLTGLYPYGRYTLSDRTTLWGVAGYAAGSLTLTQQDKAPVETDLDLAMGALGVRTVVLDAAGKIGPELAAISDAMMVRTTSAAVSNGAGKLAGARGDVTRIRAGLEGTWHGLEPAAGSLVPHLGVALRHDGGDAETGFGLDVGAGLEWTHPGTGLSAAVRARALASHEASGFDERGLAADLTWDRRRASDRGLSLTIGHTLGASASGGMDALFSRDTLTGLARADDADGPAAHQLDMRLGYGLAAFGGRFTATPEATLALGGERRGYGLGWRLAMRNDRGYGLDLRLQGIRRETDGAGRGADHAIGIEMRVQF